MPKPEKPEKKDKRPRKSLEYWKRRAEARMYEEMEKAEGSADTVSRVYAMAARYLMDKADQVFDRYQTTEKLSEAEAVQMLNSMDNIEDMNELERKLTEDGSEEAMRSLERLKNTGAYGSRIGRLGELLNQVNDLMSNIYKQDVKETRGILSEIASDSYLKTMYDHQQRIGIGFSVAHLDKKRVDKVLNMNWSGKHFSERLWGNTQKLGQRVKEEMVVGALTGKTEREMAEDISKEFGRGNMEARRLIRTESCYVASEVNAEAYEDADIEKYLFLATLDLRTSPVCRELDGKRFPVKDRQPGVNCPPMHPWCRSTTIAIVDEEYLKDMTRSMRDPETGQTEQVPLSMTYKDWYKKYVEGNDETPKYTKEETAEADIAIYKEPSARRTKNNPNSEYDSEDISKKKFKNIEPQGSVFEKNEEVISSDDYLNNNVNEPEAQEKTVIKSDSKYEDITSKLIDNDKKEQSEIIMKNSIDINGVTYNVDGIHVLLDPDENEKRIAALLSGVIGGAIEIWPRINKPKGIKTPDFFFRGEKTDLKTIEKVNNDSLYNACHKKKKQASCFVFDISKVDMSKDEAEEQAKRLFKRDGTKFVKTVYLVKGDEVFLILERK